MRVLIGCEFSGTVRDAFRRLGHDAWSCDFLPTEVEGNHYQGDVRDLLNDLWDLAIFHPSCTYLCNSGVRWLKTEVGRYEKMINDAQFFNYLLKSKIKYKAFENPIPHKYAVSIIGRSYDQIIQPWMFGHMESKKTCLWLDGLPKLVETNNVKDSMKSLPKKEQQKIHYMSPGKNRGHERSRTYSGIADAMASQWSEYVMMVS